MTAYLIRGADDLMQQVKARAAHERIDFSVAVERALLQYAQFGAITFNVCAEVFEPADNIVARVFPVSN